jgi:ADP-heptose:LPS heptosyltransferase
LDGNPYIDRVIYEKDEEKIRSMRGWGNFTKKHLFDISAAFKAGVSKGLHMTQAYGELYGVDVAFCRPVVCVTDEDRKEAAKYIPDGSFVCVSTHSVSSTLDDPKDRAGNKLWGTSKWKRLFSILTEEMGYSIVSLGAGKDPQYKIPGVKDLHDLPIKIVAAILEAADCLITIDNGLAHLGAAVNAKMVEIYPDCLPPTWVWPHADDVRVLWGYPPHISPHTVAGALEELNSEVRRFSCGGQASN